MVELIGGNMHCLIILGDSSILVAITDSLSSMLNIFLVFQSYAFCFEARYRGASTALLFTEFRPLSLLVSASGKQRQLLGGRT